MLGCDKCGLREHQELTVKPKSADWRPEGDRLSQSRETLPTPQACVPSAGQNQVLWRHAGISTGNRSSSQRFQQRHRNHQQQRPNRHHRPQRTGQNGDRHPSNRGHRSTWIGKPDAATNGHHRSNQGTAQIHSQHFAHTSLFVTTTVRCAHARWEHLRERLRILHEHLLAIRATGGRRYPARLKSPAFTAEMRWVRDDQPALSK